MCLIEAYLLSNILTRVTRPYLTFIVVVGGWELVRKL